MPGAKTHELASSFAGRTPVVRLLEVGVNLPKKIRLELLSLEPPKKKGRVKRMALGCPCLPYMNMFQHVELNPACWICGPKFRMDLDTSNAKSRDEAT